MTSIALYTQMCWNTGIPVIRKGKKKADERAVGARANCRRASKTQQSKRNYNDTFVFNAHNSIRLFI